MSLAEQLVKGLGLDPEAIKAQVAGIAADFRAIHEGVLGARVGFLKASTLTYERLGAIEARLQGVEAALAFLVARAQAQGHERFVDELELAAPRGENLPRSDLEPGQVVTPGGTIMPLRLATDAEAAAIAAKLNGAEDD